MLEHMKPPSDCNPFLILGGEKWKPPQRVYAVLDQAEPTERGSVVLLFGAMDASALDARGDEIPRLSDARNFIEIYRRLPLFLLEAEFSRDAVLRLSDGTPRSLLEDDQAGSSDVPDAALAEALARLEGMWLTFRLEEAANCARGSLYGNLFVDPEPIPIAEVSPPTGPALQLLAHTDPLAGEPDATSDDIENVLSAQGTPEAIAVYDVGQGNSNGLLHDGRVVIYFDFGGGAGRNTKTFPSVLKKFCFCATSSPPIVLSHWDHDHWSSEGRDTTSHYATWIAPRQTIHGGKRAPHHNALITSIKKYGKLLIWPNTVSTLSVGKLRIHKCTGTVKNDSGLAMEIFPPDTASGDSVLLPADAGYDDLPTGASITFDAIVCPHHGGKSNSPTVPSRPALTYARLAYSYGPKNSYGHPLKPTFTAHDTANWADARVRGSSVPIYVLNTEDRATCGLGHIGFDWGAVAFPVPPCKGTCELEIQQH